VKIEIYKGPLHLKEAFFFPLYRGGESVPLFRGTWETLLSIGNLLLKIEIEYEG